MKKDIEAPGFILPGIEDITRRDFLIGGAAALLLGGCGSGDNGASDSALVVTDDSGTEVEIPSRPERVAAVDPLGGLEALLALGIAPVQVGIRTFADEYTGEELGLWSWQKEALSELGADPERIPADESVNIERVARSNPDLIVGSASLIESGGSTLRDLAPTIEVPYEFPVAIRLLGQAFGMEEKAETVLEDFNARLADELEGLVTGGQKIVTVDPQSDGTIYMSGHEEDQPFGLLLRSGFSPVEAIMALEKDEYGYNEPLSAERLDLMEPADVIVITAFDPPSADALEEDPLFTRLPAAQAGRVFRLEQGPVAQASAVLSPVNLDTVLPFVRDVAELASRTN